MKKIILTFLAINYMILTMTSLAKADPFPTNDELDRAIKRAALKGLITYPILLSGDLALDEIVWVKRSIW